MNKIIIKGRLTKDPELKYVDVKGTSTSLCNFSVAVDRFGEGADFFNCTTWRKTAEMIAKHFFKGKEILVEGSMQMDTVDKDGEKRTYWKLNASHVEFCGSKNDVVKQEGAIPEGFTPMDDDDDENIPF